MIAINHRGLLHLAETQEIGEIWLGAEDGKIWALFVKTTHGQTVILHTAHAGVRYWKNLNSATAYVAEHCPDVEKISVDISALR